MRMELLQQAERDLETIGDGLPDPRFDFALSVALYTEWQAVLTRPENLPPSLE